MKSDDLRKEYYADRIIDKDLYSEIQKTSLKVEFTANHILREIYVLLWRIFSNHSNFLLFESKELKQAMADDNKHIFKTIKDLLNQAKIALDEIEKNIEEIEKYCIQREEVDAR